MIVLILTIGNINVDLICQVPRLPKPDDKVVVSNLEIVPGGGACNFAVGLSRLGTKVSLFGHVGDDQNGKMGLVSLEKENIDVTKVIKEEKQATGFVIILVDKEGQTIKIGYREANAKLAPSDITKKLLGKANIVHASSISAKVAFKIAEMCKKKGIISSIDFGGELMNEPMETLQKIINDYSIVFLNQIAFEKSFGFPPTNDNLNKISLNDSTILNVTLGAKGSFILTKGKIEKVSAYEVPVVDTTGAGDAYAAGFIHCYHQHKDLLRCGAFASACAALQITLLNARDGMPYLNEVTDFIQARNKKHNTN